jgi:hypothetical protein
MDKKDLGGLAKSYVELSKNKTKKEVDFEDRYLNGKDSGEDDFFER